MDGQLGAGVALSCIDLGLCQENAAGQIRSAKMGITQVGTNPIGMSQVRIAKITSNHQSTPEARASQINPCQIRS